MNRPEYRYKQIDLNNDKAIGIELPFNYKNGLFKLSYTTEEQAVSNLKNLLMTSKGERYGEPELGVGLRKYLFENNTEDLRVKIEDTLYSDIATWLPYILIDELKVEVGEIDGVSGHVIHIAFKFRVTEQGANREINILVTTSDGILFV